MKASSFNDVDDKELVRLAQGGDTTAFEHIVGRYHGKMFHVAMSCLRNEADAEEVANDTFVRAHRGLTRFRGESSLATWLHRIALNLSRNRYAYYKRRRRDVTLSLDYVVGEHGDCTIGDVIPTPEHMPAEHAEHIELERLVSRAVPRLTPGHRAVLNMRNDQHLDYAEIANRLGINIGTVKSRLARARQCLRQQITSTCPGLKGTL